MPEGWAWERIGNVLELINGRAYKKPELLSKGKYRVLRVGNFFTNYSWYFSDLELEDNKYCYDGDLLYAWSASFGPKIWTGDKTIFHYHIWNVRFDEKLFSKFFLYYFLLKDVDTIKESTSGSTMVHVSMENMKPRFICIPPLAEQQRIVSIIENIFLHIDTVEQNKFDLQTEIKQAKMKILDLAIHGKLVPQNPNDEPAEELLKRIATSDNRPYEKFDKDDSPYTLPTNWAWCYLGDLCKISSAKRVLQQDWKDSGIPFYRAREIAQLSNNEKVKDDLFITPELYNELKSKYGVPSSGDLMISAVGTIGKIYIVKETDCFYYKDASVICFSKKEKNINSKFLKLCLESSFLQNQIYSQSTGTTVDTITINKAQEYLFPLPSIKEQSLIVSKIEELFSYLDNITINLV